MIRPLINTRAQTRYDVEELDASYYIMDGSKKRVTFDDDDELPNQDELPPIETNGNEIDDQEDEETVSVLPGTTIEQ